MQTKLGRIGVGSWTFPWAAGTVTEHAPAEPLRLGGLLERAQKLRVGVVQVVDNMRPENYGPAEWQTLRQQADEANIHLEVGSRGVEPERLLGLLGIATTAGARLVRTMCGWPGEHRTLGDVEADLRQSLPEFERAGVTIALENYEAYPTADLGALVGRINSPNLGICLDLTNSFGALESAEQILEALALHTVNVHLKEFVVERTAHLMGFAFKGRPTGQGKLPLTQIFETLVRHGRSPNVIVELWTPFQGSLERTLDLEQAWARQSVEFLRSLPFF